MQLVFFHGLEFDSSSDIHLSTWECGDGSCWPQTWLVRPDAFPRAQVFSVAYNAGVRPDSQVLDLFRLAENLTSDFMDVGIGQSLDCPVVMIGHSFGGLVIKELCCHAHDKLHSIREGSQKVKLQSFLGNIRGVFYYATPHHGSEFVEEMTDSQAHPLLKYFRTLYAEAERLNSRFDDIRARHGKWEVNSLGESLPIKSRFGTHMIVVEASARIENFYTVPGTDHFSICKPKSTTSASFSKLKTFLANIVEESEVEVKKRKEAKAREGNKFDNIRQHLPEYLVGVDDQLQEILEKLVNARTLGLFGMGGLGKTTIAKALFNQLGPTFDYACFVPKVKDIVGEENILKDEVWKWMHFQGKRVGPGPDWSALKEQKLLLVLDDIASERDLIILSFLCGLASSESRFIVTSREGELEKRFENMHPVSFLTDSTSRELFMKHAFRGEREEPDTLKELVDAIVRKCDHLPLALEVLGSSLYSRVNRKEWEETIVALEQAQVWSNVNEKLWAKLRISYNKLTWTEQQIFLDVTAFFNPTGTWVLRLAKAAWRVAYDVNNVELLWQKLVRLFLVMTESEDEPIKVHEQLQNMGAIIALESKDLRIWDGDKGLRALMLSSQSNEPDLLSLQLGIDSGFETIHNIPKHALRRLQKCRYLNVNYPHELVLQRTLVGEVFANQLVLLACHANAFGRALFHPSLQENLVGLHLYSNIPDECVHITRGWVPACFLHGRDCPVQSILHKLGNCSKLEFLNFGGCKCVRTLPESFCKLTSLKNLSLDGLPNLQRLPESFGQLEALTVLLIYMVDKLRSLPESFGTLKALQRLQLDECKNLRTLPNSFGQLRALRELSIDDSEKLDSLPDSFGQLEALSHLTFKYCLKLRFLRESFGELKALQVLELEWCEELQALPNSFGQLEALKILKISDCRKLQSLPESFGQLRALRELTIHSCPNLDSLPDSFVQLKALQELTIGGCPNLDSLPNSFGQLEALSHLTFYCFTKLKILPESFGDLKSLSQLEFHACPELQSLPESFGHLKALSHEEFLDCPSLQTMPEFFYELKAMNNLELLEATRTLGLLEKINLNMDIFTEKILRGVKYCQKS